MVGVVSVTLATPTNDTNLQLLLPLLLLVFGHDGVLGPREAFLLSQSPLLLMEPHLSLLYVSLQYLLQFTGYLQPRQ